MRHSDINLTMNLYTHTLIGDRAKATAARSGESSPLSKPLAEPTESRKERADLQGDLQGADWQDLANIGQFESLEKMSAQGSSNAKKSLKTANIRCFEASEVEPPTRLERVTCGLQNRCSTGTTSMNTGTYDDTPECLAGQLAGEPAKLTETGHCQTPQEDLQKVIAAWSALPSSIKVGIMAMVKATEGQ